MNTKDEYIKKMEVKMDEWSGEILKVRAEKAEADLKINYMVDIEKLREKQATAKKKLSELNDAGEDAWEDIKTGIESSWAELKKGIASATSRFK
ncbi:MAG: coiled coil domain-containing protein [Nitrospinae bacterium]|nr:coiled coil domain-containing protein [Nitrospinota bacterium]MBL7020613.1 coiled coil domain-containing protein [Nitrospinaceae bacterium]